MSIEHLYPLPPPELPPLGNQYGHEGSHSSADPETNGRFFNIPIDQLRDVMKRKTMEWHHLFEVLYFLDVHVINTLHGWSCRNVIAGEDALCFIYAHPHRNVLTSKPWDHDFVRPAVWEAAYPKDRWNSAWCQLKPSPDNILLNSLKDLVKPTEYEVSKVTFEYATLTLPPSQPESDDWYYQTGLALAMLNLDRRSDARYGYYSLYGTSPVPWRS